LVVDGLHETVNVWAVRQDDSLTLLLTNHALPRHSIEAQPVTLRISEAREPRHIHVERIDDAHANPQRAWCEMGAPEYLSALQVEQLQAASRMVREPLAWKYANGVVQLDIDLPPHAIAAIAVAFA